MSASDWRPLIESTLHRVWPELPNGTHWIEAQVDTESAGDPNARSPVGAMGLLQLMPQTAAELGVKNAFSPDQNLDGGVRYLRIQHDHLAEIPREPDRLYWSFAAYNCGRGFVNVALYLGKQASAVHWWEWDIGRWFLRDPRCKVLGRSADYTQVWDYVNRIIQRFSALSSLE